MNRKIAVIGVGNMAKAIISGIIGSHKFVDEFFLYDTNQSACEEFEFKKNFYVANSISEAVNRADCVLLSVKPQNYPAVLPRR